MCKPLFGIAIHETVSFAACVVLMDDRTEPIDHLTLYLYWAWSSGMEYTRQCRNVVLGANFWSQLEHAHKHGRHCLCVGHLVALNAMKKIFSIKVIHHYRGSACAMYRHIPAKRCCVIQRSRGQVNGVFVKRKEKLSEAGKCIWRA